MPYLGRTTPERLLIAFRPAFVQFFHIVNVHKYCLPVLFCLTACLTHAEPAKIIPIWPEGKMPGRVTKQSEAEKPESGDGVRRIVDVENPTLSLFPATERGKPAPAVLICPGGGYRILAFAKEGTEIAAWLNSAGITAAVLQYRIPGNKEGAYQDIQRALRLMRHHAAEWNIDPARIGVMGFSAGGHLAARLSTGFGQPAYEAIDEVDDASARPDFAVLVYPAYLKSKENPAPELDLKADIPATLLVHSEDDPALVSGTKIYAAALGAAGVSHEFLLYPTGGHGYGLHSKGDAKIWPEQTLGWLKNGGMTPN